jgi:hypothetical protein
MPIIKTCERCNREFSAPPARRRYCGKECYLQRNITLDGLRRCSWCGESKPLDAFNQGGKKPEPRCKACRSAEWHGNAKHNKARLREAYQRRKENHNLLEKMRVANREQVRKLRAETVAAYGSRCACCGETTFEFLAIDHINGGGSYQRNQLKRRGVNFYRWLKKQGFPTDNYQLLCHNCNMAKGFYGVCPHQRERGESQRQEAA